MLFLCQGTSWGGPAAPWVLLAKEEYQPCLALLKIWPQIEKIWSKCVRLWFKLMLLVPISKQEQWVLELKRLHGSSLCDFRHPKKLEARRALRQNLLSHQPPQVLRASLLLSEHTFTSFKAAFSRSISWRSLQGEKQQKEMPQKPNIFCLTTTS